MYGILLQQLEQTTTEVIQHKSIQLIVSFKLLSLKAFCKRKRREWRRKEGKEGGNEGERKGERKTTTIILKKRKRRNFKKVRARHGGMHI
jgi:hypothetical protein